MSSSNSTKGTGKNCISSLVTPSAPVAGPPHPCGEEKVLWRLKKQRSKSASFALVTPKIPLALACSYPQIPPDSWTIFVNSLILGLKIPVSSGFVINNPAVLSETASSKALTSGNPSSFG